MACVNCPAPLSFGQHSSNRVVILRFLSVPFAALVLVSAFVITPLRPAMAEALFTSPVPAWVLPVAVPAADPVVQAAVTDGVLTLLSDEQVQWDGEERQIFLRTARLITDQAGIVVAGRVDLTFAPESEAVLLNRVTVTRGAEVIDLTDIATTQTLEATEGRVAVEVVVPDLQVGDVVEVAYLRRQLPVIAGVNRAGAAQLERDAPVVLAQVVVNWPESWPIYISGWPARVGFVQATAPGVIRHTWTRLGHVPAVPEPFLPPGYSDNTVIAYSAFPDWSAVTGALSAHYMGSYPLGAVWDTRLRAIQAQSSYPGERAMAALRAVQDDLRTDAGPLATNGWLARLPADVTAAGSGDAKAKALLLRTMLDKMGIEAYVALTNRAHGHDLNGKKPAFGAFDHAIVQAMIDGMPYWMDPSASGEGGDFYSAVTPDFGYALPLAGADKGQLAVIDPGYNGAWTTYIDESYDFTLLGVYVTVATSHYGAAANAHRQTQNVKGASAESAYQASLTARFPDLRVLGAVEVTDDRISNAMTLTERYLIPATSLAALDTFEVQAVNPLAFLPDTLPAPRAAPLFLGHTFTLTHHISLLNMPIAGDAWLTGSAYNDAFSFAASGYQSGPRDMSLDWTFDLYKPSVTPDAVDQLLRDVAQIDAYTSFAFSLRP